MGVLVGVFVGMMVGVFVVVIVGVIVVVNVGVNVGSKSGCIIGIKTATIKQHAKITTNGPIVPAKAFDPDSLDSVHHEKPSTPI